jgi:alginate O-acetyltransferase complex protein AlgJ
VMRDARRHGAVYHRTDTRWNARGAFLATRALLKEAAKRVPAIEPPPIEGVHLVRSPGFRGDLADAAKVVPDAGALVPLDAAGEAWTEEVDEVDVTTLRSQPMPAGSHLEGAVTPAPRVYEIAGAEDLPRAVLVGDSCCLALVPWLAERFRRLVFMRTPEPPLEAVELEMPDVLIHVTAERDLLEPPGASDT